ncbi:MAG: SMP-30/gluconolactonase/LRE family protein [Candidatus Hydrogenedens sp.]|nr:SMP-30/gluconolactonase/LRE family protein [Candidatus Hydrogenedens sp.]
MIKFFVRSLLAIVLLGAAAALYLLFWPVPIDPAPWNAPKAPALEGPLAVNDALASVSLLGEGVGSGPEDIAVDFEGRIYGGLLDGRLIRWDKDAKNPETVADTGGRPLGLHVDSDGRLILCVVGKGILALEADGTLSTLTTGTKDYTLHFPDDLDAAADGTIYFSDASSKFDHTNYALDFLEHRPNGKFFSYDPKTGETTLLADNLYFANGIAVDPRQEFVLINETSKYRILRYWLTPEKRGQIDVFVDNLPGFPDGVSAGSREIFWVAIASPRDQALDALLAQPFTRKVVARLPKFLQPRPQRYGIVLGINREGEIVHNLQDPGGKFAPITSVQEANGNLYLGSLTEPCFGKLPRPEEPR